MDPESMSTQCKNLSIVVVLLEALALPPNAIQVLWGGTWFLEDRMMW